MISHSQLAPQRPDRVVLLGGNGFIGDAIRRQLLGRDVNVLAPASADCNLLDPQSAAQLQSMLRPLDAVVMAAALTPDRGRDMGTFMKNLAMVQHLAAALAAVPCTHLVYFSSDAVYPAELSRVAEAAPASPRDLYGVMHYAREVMLREVKHVPILILRPTLVYGARDTHNAYGPNRFCRSAAGEGTISLFGEGEELRDHVHVDDVARLTVRCILHRSRGTLNVATGTSMSFRAVAQTVAGRFAPRQIDIRSTPRVTPVTHRHYDVANLVKAFPDFRFTAFEAGIAALVTDLQGEK
ncbi:MAG TPA: SDR family oxidoreductase [Candidatus Acidoferrum sp.]|jgi:UDP-glucose 4-epimerase|nr:SDR family oxidoreductase [Candidatus Acidoferrum sp.]